MFDPLLWTQHPGGSCWSVLAQWWHRRDLAGRLWLQYSPLRSTRRVPLISLWFLVEENFPAIPVAMQSANFPSHQFILDPVWSLLAPKVWVEGLWEKTYMDYTPTCCHPCLLC